ncbi:MAG: PilC/PilY family type IV pilus protein, partial [Deltaproteobacteria bacterium]
AVRCWQGTTGQYLYVVDLQTGALIRRFGPTGSPIVGSPSLWVGTPGAVSTRAYVGDADGDVWRLDMSDPDPTRWRFAVSFDGFYDAGQMAGQPIVAPPVLSVDRNGDTLIAIGSGDPDLLEGFDRNLIATYREAAVTDTAGAVTSVTASNVWQQRYGTDNTNGDLFAGERLTGNLSLFNGNLYFGTFVPANSADSCQLGFSRLWGVDQVQVVGGRPAARLDLDGDPSTTADVVRVTQDINGNGSITDDANAVLFGVGIVRRPTCVTTTATTDPYLGTPRQFVDGMSGGDFRLVVQTGRGGSSAGGSRTNVVSRVIPPPITETSVKAWAVVFE